MATDRVKRNARRVMAAAYRLARGRPMVPVAEADLQAEIERERLFALSDDAFRAYELRVRAEGPRSRRGGGRTRREARSSFSDHVACWLVGRD